MHNYCKILIIFLDHAMIRLEETLSYYSNGFLEIMICLLKSEKLFYLL